MASEQVDLTKLLQSICHVLDSFDFPIGSSIIERAAANRVNDSNNIQLLANLKQELIQLPSLTTIDMNVEMRWFIQALIDSVKATSVIDKKFITRSINKLDRGFEPFAKNDMQHTALIEMQTVKEDVLNVEPRHRIGHKSRKQRCEEEEKDSDLYMTRELQASGY